MIRTELEEIQERYGDARRTEIVQAEGDISIEDSDRRRGRRRDRDARRATSSACPIGEYREQGRGGKGTRAMDTRDEDFVSYIFVANTHAHVLYLSDKGIAYLKKVYEIPEGSRTARGRAIVNFVGMNADDRVAAIVPIKELVDDGYLITCTKNGTVKRTALAAYGNIRQTGIIGVGIAEGDELLTARVVSDEQHVIIGTQNGMSIRFDVADVRPMGRDARGVKGIELREGDRVIGMDAIESADQQVLTISANGYGKRTPVADYRPQNRGGIGIIALETSERNGPLVKLRLVRPDDQIMVITDGGQVIRTRVSEIRETGRNAQGVRIIRLNDTEHVVDVEPVATEGDEPTGDTVRPPPPSEPPPADD